jgi:hypothetical protein
VNQRNLSVSANPPGAAAQLCRFAPRSTPRGEQMTNGQARPAHSANNANTFPNHGGSGAQALRLEGPVILLTDLDPWQLEPS